MKPFAIQQQVILRNVFLLFFWEIVKGLAILLTYPHYEKRVAVYALPFDGVSWGGRETKAMAINFTFSPFLLAVAGILDMAHFIVPPFLRISACLEAYHHPVYLRLFYEQLCKLMRQLGHTLLQRCWKWSHD